MGVDPGKVYSPAAREPERLNARNYRITLGDRLGLGGLKQKVRDNIAAIELVRRLETENRIATEEERRTLVKYVGWGAMPQVFAYHGAEDWQLERNQMKALLSPEEYDAARASTLNAHYTSPGVIGGLYEAVERLGFTGGRVLEPALGAGHFFGLMPVEMARRSRLVGIELDPLTSCIALERPMLLATFQPEVARASRVPVRALGALIAASVVRSATVSFQAAGVVPMVALMIAPAATMSLLTDRVSTMLWAGTALGIAGAVGGVALAVAWNFSGAATIALLLGAAFVFAPSNGIVARWRREEHRWGESFRRWHHAPSLAQPTGGADAPAPFHQEHSVMCVKTTARLVVSACSTTSRPRSQVRALMRDLAEMMIQQMFFWGCDARHADGNLLVRVGAQRIAREHADGEGSSRYRFRWEGGTIELHSFCAGWYSSGGGVILVRSRGRFFECAGDTPLTRGLYEEERFRFANVDELLTLCRRFLTWLADYEHRIEAITATGYRDRCFAQYRRHGRGRPWLPSMDARRWLAQWLASPEQTPRARTVSRAQLASSGSDQ